MASLDYTFDANNVEPAAPRDIIPAGKYPAQAVKSDVGPTKAGTGKVLTIEWDIIDGEFKGRKLWSRVNIVNPSAEAQEIAQRELSSICRATGQMVVSDSEALHFKPVLLGVAVDPPRRDQKTGKEYGASNSVKSYEPLPRGGYHAPAPSGTPPAARAAPEAEYIPRAETAAAAPPATGANPPWRRG